MMPKALKLYSLMAVVVTMIAVVSVADAQPQESREIPAFIAARLASWYQYYIIWAAVQVTLGVTGIVLSVVVGTVQFSDANKKRRVVFGVSAAAIATILTFLAPAVSARAYAQAWRTLDSACRQYQVDPTMPLSKLNEAVDEGEKELARNALF